MRKISSLSGIESCLNNIDHESIDERSELTNSDDKIRKSRELNYIMEHQGEEDIMDSSCDEMNKVDHRELKFKPGSKRTKRTISKKHNFKTQPRLAEIVKM